MTELSPQQPHMMRIWWQAPSLRVKFYFSLHYFWFTSRKFTILKTRRKWRIILQNRKFNLILRFWRRCVYREELTFILPAFLSWLKFCRLAVKKPVCSRLHHVVTPSCSVVINNVWLLDEISFQVLVGWKWIFKYHSYSHFDAYETELYKKFIIPFTHIQSFKNIFVCAIKRLVSPLISRKRDIHLRNPTEIYAREEC